MALKGEQQNFAGIAYFTLDVDSKSLADRVRKTWEVYKVARVNWERFKEAHKSPGHHMLEKDGEFPLLFLYSEKDKLIPARFMDALVERQRDEFGRMVRAKNFGASGHVAHFKNFPDEYEEEIVRFMQATRIR